MDNQVVVFELCGEFYGVSIAAVESIIKMQQITRLPQAPSFVEGITNLRGKVLPVVDLRKRFGLAAQAADKDSRIIVTSAVGAAIGMIVDGVSEVLTVPDRCVETAPTITTTVDSSFITGIAMIDQRLVILLDLDKILTTQEQDSLVEIAG